MKWLWKLLVKATLSFASRAQRKQFDMERGSFGRGGDRNSLRLKSEHVDLIAQAASLNPNVIVALVGGSAIVIEEWKHLAKAIMMIWYPGQEGGHALADIVFGKRNPSGRLPFSIPIKEADLPFFDKDASAITYDLWHGYRKLRRDNLDAAYPFGFGLSYTEFSIDSIECDNDRYQSGDTAALTVCATNTGLADGDLVIQIYASSVDTKVERADRELKAFARLSLESGETRSIVIPLPLERLAFFDTAIDDFRIEPGQYRITAAQHVDDERGQEVAFGIGIESSN